MHPLRHAMTSIRLRTRRGLVALRRLRGARARSEVHATAPSAADLPIIIAGCHRSGTSLVRRIIDSHPQIACPAETQFLEWFGAAIAGETGSKGFAAIGMDVGQAASDLGALADTYLSAYARSKGKPRWAEKSPGTVRQLPAVDMLFGHQAKFLLVCRDGRDVATSLGGTRWSVVGHYYEVHENPYIAAAHYWVDLNRRLLAFLNANPTRTHLLRYEDLVLAPEVTLKRVFQFLEEPWDPSVLDFNKAAHDGGLEDHYVSATWRIEDNRGRWQTLPPALRSELWGVVHETMLDLGYVDSQRNLARSREFASK